MVLEGEPDALPDRLAEDEAELLAVPVALADAEELAAAEGRAGGVGIGTTGWAVCVWLGRS